MIRPGSPAWLALRLGVLAALVVGALQAIHLGTRERIAAAQQARQRNALALALPARLHDNDLVADRIAVKAPRWLGTDEPLAVHRARHGGAATGLAIEAVAPDGYAGPIRLLIGVDAHGRVLGVRVTAHRETPGLGDPIAAERSDWHRQFFGRSLAAPPPERWRVRRDGGDFDQLAGATISPRAVVHATRRALGLVATHGATLYAAPAGSTLELDDGPHD
jgi:Na+-translocating ferredoxin:NAD+ oxidoreductase subunit G